MSLLPQLILAEKYGMRLSMDQLAAELNVKKTTLYNQVSGGRCAVRTYTDGGQRWADVRDVADYFDSMRALAA